MRKSELEQRLRENNYRISKLTERIEQLEKDLSNKRLQSFLDEIYGHIEKQNAMRDETFSQLQQKAETVQHMKQEFWMAQYTYDKMISEIQMHLIEQISPGNRRALMSLQNTHAGEKCFVIGNGPSLEPGDLERIKEKGIFSFASKGIYTIFNQTQWRPDIWGVSDLNYIELKKDVIDELDGFLKLVCAQSVIAKGIPIKNAIYYPFIQAERQPRFFNIDVLNGVH